MSISLVYLCRGKDAGVDAAEKFIHFYSKYESGCDHDLVVIFKGWDKSQIKDKENLKVKFLYLSANIIELEDDGFDWAAFMRVTPMLKTDFVCYLNTFSRPLCNLWLKNMYDCIKIKDVGICGATASYKAWRFSFPLFEFRLLPMIIYPLKVLRRLSNHLLLLGYYPRKFCPHIRSNGFAVKRKQFLSFVSSTTIPKSKRDCYRLESGIGSYSNYVTEENQRLVLVDKNGNFFDILDWIKSKTYCCPGQPELCIADNNTDLYNKQSVANKRQMEFDVWGSVLHE